MPSYVRISRVIYSILFVIFCWLMYTNLSSQDQMKRTKSEQTLIFNYYLCDSDIKNGYDQQKMESNSKNTFASVLLYLTIYTIICIVIIYYFFIFPEKLLNNPIFKRLVYIYENGIYDIMNSDKYDKECKEKLYESETNSLFGKYLSDKNDEKSIEQRLMHIKNDMNAKDAINHNKNLLLEENMDSENKDAEKDKIIHETCD